MRVYVIDSSIWIGLARDHPLDVSIYASLWRNLEQGAASGMIAIPDEVHFELTRGNDLLADWIKDLKCRHPSAFLPSNRNVQRKVQEVMRSCPSLVDPDSDKNHADPFVVACAVLCGGIVVCGESARKHPNGPYKVPDACSTFGVRCIKYLEFAREYPWVP